MEKLALIITIILGVLALIGHVTGFFRWLWENIKSISSKTEGDLKIPKKTLALVVRGTGNDCWWHMGSSDGKPAMQIVAKFTATNICTWGVLPISAKMRKPKQLGHVMARKHDGNIWGGYVIPTGFITDLSVDFWISPPIKKEGEAFKANIAIVDQFGNEHWVKNLEFKYR